MQRASLLGDLDNSSNGVEKPENKLSRGALGRISFCPKSAPQRLLGVIEGVARGISSLSRVGAHTAGGGRDDVELVLLDRELALLGGDVDVAADIGITIEPGLGVAVLDIDREGEADVTILPGHHARARCVAIDRVGLHEQVSADLQRGFILHLNLGIGVDHADGDGHAGSLGPHSGGIGEDVDRMVDRRAEGGVLCCFDFGSSDDHIGVGHGHTDRRCESTDHIDRLGIGEGLGQRFDNQLIGINGVVVGGVAKDRDVRFGLRNRYGDL